LESVGHLSPVLLKKELMGFREAKGYLPRVVVSHIPPTFQREVGREIKKVARELGARIDLGYEDMKVNL
jgi:hypothetical protein